MAARFRLALQSSAKINRLSIKGTPSARRHGYLSSSSSSSLASALNSPRQDCDHDRNRKHACRFSSTSERGGGDVGQDASADKVDKYGDGTGPVKTPFPWREASHPEAVPQGLLATLASWMLSEADPSVERGAEAAMVCAAAAFFRMRQAKVLDPHPSRAGESDAAQSPSDVDEDSSETWTEEAERIATVVDMGLIDFSSDHRAALHARGVEPYYRLHAVVAATVTSRRVILGRTRGTDTSGYTEGTGNPGMVALIDLKKPQEQMILELLQTAVVQLDVDVECYETFYVADRESGEVIQGSKDKTGRKHRLRLEGTQIEASNFVQPQWKVVDLDGWLRGNQFW